jgi:hypothetical protein
MRAFQSSYELEIHYAEAGYIRKGKNRKKAKIKEHIKHQAN